MYKKIICGLLSYTIIMVVAFSSAYAQHKSPFNVIKQPGSGLYRIVYHPVLAGFDAALPVKGVVYNYKNFKWTGQDVKMLKTDTGWVADYSLPDGVGLASWRFWVGSKVDNGNQQAYLMMPKMAIPGVRTECVIVRRKQFGTMLNSPLVNKNIFINPKASLVWIPADWPVMSVRRKRLVEMVDALKEANDGKVDSSLLPGIAQVAALSDVTEKELLMVRTVYQEVLGDKKKSDSINKVILGKYPKGLAYRQKLIMKWYGGNAELWNEFKKEWPHNQYSFEDYLNPLYGHAFFNQGLANIATKYYMSKDWNAVLKTLSSVSFNQLDYYYEHFVDYPHRTVEQQFPEKDIVDLARSIMDTIETRMVSADNYRSGRGFYSPDEWKREVLMEFKDSYAYHAGLLYRNGFYKEAMQYAERIKPYTGTSNIKFNEVYVNLLVKLKREKEAYPFIRKAIADNYYTPNMLEVLKRSEVSKNMDTKAFDEYVFSLKSKEGIAREHAAIIKAMCNIPFEPFKLKNLKGEEVDIAKQKGKIVVLDFWATWCYPCKQAMPGMQIAVNKYEKDQDVEFYFISTMEVDPNYKKFIDQFLKEKKYTFNVLYDELGSSGKMDRVYNIFLKAVKATGIPLKIIIDQKGNIRWMNLGGSSNAIQVADEVNFVVDFLKKEKS